MGFYVVGAFDMLGQSRKLLRPMEFPPTTDDEARNVARNLTETAVAVDQFRQLFRQQFASRRGEFDRAVTEMPPALRDGFRAALAPSLESWGVSDTCFVAVPIVAGSGATGATATMADVRRLLETAAAVWLLSLATGHSIRGGVEIGTAVKMRENDVYGAALVEAHCLESKVAQGSRLVIGEQLCGALQGARRDRDVRFQGAAKFATDCCSLLKQDLDGKTVIDVLGSWVSANNRWRHPLIRDALPRAHDHARRELDSHRRAGDDKLIRRYETLLADFDEHAPRWQER